MFKYLKERNKKRTKEVRGIKCELQKIKETNYEMKMLKEI